MISRLSGTIVEKSQPGKLVLDVHGVGYEVETSLHTFFQVESSVQPVTLMIHMIVREDAFLLYGFVEEDERTLFRALIKVNGVGPKLAIAILSSVQPQDFIRCIQQQSADALKAIPGIGKKTADRLLVEMKDSIQKLQIRHTTTSTNTFMPDSALSEATAALESLGYKKALAQDVLAQIDQTEPLSCEQLIRLALQRLAVTMT